MAHQTEQRNEKDRRILHCLLCQKPQEVLSAHLARVCRKSNTKEEREAELKRAKALTKSWTRQGRNWDYRQICSIVMDRASRMALVQHLEERDFFISNKPEEADRVVLEQQPSTGVTVTREKPTVASETTMEAVEDSSWSEHDEDNDASDDPTYQEPSSASWGRARCNMLQMGLYEKFNSDNPLLVEFKKYLVNHMEFPNCKQEVDNVSRMLRYIQPTGEEIDMDFLRKGTEVKDYIESLKGAKLVPSTILNFIKNMIRFVQFLAIRNIDMEFYMRCYSYVSLLHTLKKPVSKAHSKVTYKTSSDESADRMVGRGQKRAREAIEEDSATRRDFPLFLEVFPASLTGPPPTKRQRAEAGFPEDRVFYDKWRGAQFAKREEYILSKFYRHPPTVEKVARMISREGWTANHPHPENVVAKWRPPTKCATETDEGVMKRIRKQKWSGLAIKDFGERRGQGVVATRPFAKGSIICDYHGELITAEEGRRILEGTTDQRGYLFFFSSGGNQLCIDAQTHPCKCHPSMETFGRKVNHSRKNPNVKPVHCKMKFTEGERDTLLLVAAKDIAVDQKLKFDYGVNRKSFCGEGLDLEWLDH